MPKMKSHSGVKKRFKLTAKGKVKTGQSGKQHFMRRRSKSQIRDLRGTTTLSPADAKRVVKVYMPNA